ncbi:MAG: hypothetical protein II870_05345 [Synergistaceae bacterium]|nr:hypothetical protein [Synergistaceae bacterium]
MLSKFKNLLSASLILILLSGYASLLYAAEINSPFDETIRILERWTSAHWGRDCYVWIVHYPMEIAEPWASSEALKVGMSESEAEAYKNKFISDLKLDEAETFLLNIYSFGTRPVNISPIAENISLITSSGERVKPTRYDSSLDYVSSGIVQGLIFFPKQSNQDYAIAIKGLGVHDERVFSFSTPNYNYNYIPAGNIQAQEQNASEPEIIVVDIPKANANNKANANKNNINKKVVKVNNNKQPERRTVERVNETENYTPQAPQARREVPPLFAEESKDMSDFVKTAREPKALKQAKANSPSNNNSKPLSSHNANIVNSNNNSENSYVSREYVLKNFLRLWSENKPAEMYDMLAESSKKLISRENFAKEIAKSSDFRAMLKGEYKINWIGEERAKIVGDKKVLMFKTLVSRTFGVVRENSSWKIVW